jgi:ribonuclease HI
MPSFQCQVCQVSFEVPAAALARYAGWTPRHCQEHRPRRAQARTAPRGGRPRGTGQSGQVTLAQVLAAHSGGPADGLFTDGSASPNPGPGGWGVVWVRDGEVLAQRHGSAPRTTNNRMELTALIEAYRLLPADAAETVRTDSKLCVDTITRWAPGWECKGWTKKGGDIKNLELVQELLALVRAHPASELEWIAAHAGHRWNEYADSLATAWMRAEL